MKNLNKKEHSANMSNSKSAQKKFPNKLLRFNDNEEQIQYQRDVTKQIQKRELIKIKMKLEKSQFEIRTLSSVNHKLNQQIKMVRDQLKKKSQYINKIEQQLLKKASSIDNKLLGTINDLELKLKAKQKQLKSINLEIQQINSIKKQNEIFKRFINKAGKNLSNQVLILENQKIDLEKKIVELELQKQPTYQKGNELNRQIKLQLQTIEQLNFFLQQKQVYIENLEKQNTQLKKMQKTTPKSHTKNIKNNELKQDIFGIILSSFPDLRKQFQYD